MMLLEKKKLKMGNKHANAVAEREGKLGGSYTTQL